MRSFLIIVAILLGAMMLRPANAKADADAQQDTVSAIQARYSACLNASNSDVNSIKTCLDQRKLDFAKLGIVPSPAPSPSAVPSPIADSAESIQAAFIACINAVKSDNPDFVKALSNCSNSKAAALLNGGASNSGVEGMPSSFCSGNKPEELDFCSGLLRFRTRFINHWLTHGGSQFIIQQRISLEFVHAAFAGQLAHINLYDFHILVNGTQFNPTTEFEGADIGNVAQGDRIGDGVTLAEGTSIVKIITFGPFDVSAFPTISWSTVETAPHFDSSP